jgi:adenylate cyclase
VRLGGVRRELSVLFSDIRGFSRFSENMEPEALSSFLNEYLTPMTELVMEHGGMLDKYIGDAVMAVYGAPLAMAEHADSACRTALQMQARLEQLNVEWEGRGLPRIDIGIGLNSGTVSVGNMGSEVRFDYTVMGDTVNLGARLEALTKEYRAKILVGQDTWQAAGDGLVFRELDFVRVKGRSGAVQVYELIGEHGDTPMDAEQLDAWHEALTRYRERDWPGAKAAFDQYTARWPDDGTAEMMVERVAWLTDNKPGEGWDGVYEQRNK